MSNDEISEATASTPVNKKKKRYRIKNFILCLLFVFIIMQFFQPDKNNSDIVTTHRITNTTIIPDSINYLLQIACYDCHSDNTRYPWYSNIQPAGWWIAKHVKNGKKHLNFDAFSTYTQKKQLKKLEEIKESVEEGWMPLQSYTWIHKDAILDATQKKILLNWIDSINAKITAE